MPTIAIDSNGNVLSYAEYGDPNGFPILIQHGLIASIKDAAIFERLVGLGARLICTARPGYGDTSPLRMQRIADWAGAVGVLIDALGLAQLDVLAMSSGAPYAYAIGAQYPKRLRYLYVFSGTPALFDEAVQAHWPYPLTPHASLAEMETLAHQLFFAGCTPEDLGRNDIRDSMRNHCFGIAQDLQLRCVDWGFPMAAIQAPVYMRHCRADPSVPLVTAELTAGMLPNCCLEIKESDVHFSDETLDDFLRTVIAPHYPQ